MKLMRRRGWSQRRIRALEDQLKEKESEIQRLKKRLRRLGSGEYEYLDIQPMKVVDVEIDPVAYGNYVLLSPNCGPVFGENVEKIVKTIAQALLDNELVQIIVRSSEEGPDPLSQFISVAAKIRVIPWEQTVQSVKVDLVER